jgi:hypothetical protein
MRGSKVIPAILLGLIAITVGCVPVAEEAIGSEEITPSSLPSTPLAPPTEPTPTRNGIPGGLEAAVELANQDLAERLAMPIDKIAIVSAEVVEWPDASLGCPKPGMIYAQVITPGYRFILEVGGEQYEYHSDNDGGQLISCQDDGERIEVIRGMVSPEKAIAAAREDMARRLSMSATEVTIVSVAEDLFPASNLGCPCPNCPEPPIPAFVTGQRIILAAQDKNYEYHARGIRAVFCGER